MKLSDIKISSQNLRENKDDADSLENLKASIKKSSLINKISLRLGKKEGTYEVVAGSRRFKALCEIHPESYELKEQEYTLYSDLSDDDAILLSIEENTQRAPYSPLELNRAALALNRAGCKDKEVAQKLNVTPHRLKRIYQLSQDFNKMPDKAKEELQKTPEQAKLSDNHWDKIHDLEDKDVIKEVVDYIIDKESPAREVPSIIKAIEKTHELIDGEPGDKKPTKAEGAVDEPVGPIEYVHKGELKLVEDKGKVTLTVEGAGEDKEVPLDHYLEYLRHPEKFRVTINLKMKVKPLD